MTVTSSANPTGTVAVASLTRVLEEGYGAGAWHGPDLKAALEDVTETIAFTRPTTGRHSIAEIAVHHAFYARSVRAQLTGTAPEPFVLDGDDWFALEAAGPLSWADVRRAVDGQHQALAAVVKGIEDGRISSPLGLDERINLVLGITCHAVYHAGQIQLVKKLIA